MGVEVYPNVAQSRPTMLIYIGGLDHDKLIVHCT
jgi:hypothetical protein